MESGSRTAERLMSRTVIWLAAAVAVVPATALRVAWLGKQSEPVGLSIIDKQADSTATVEKAASPPSQQLSSAAPPSGPPPTTTPPAVPMPTFDLARIEPDGRAVVAGRAQPGAKTILLDGGKEIAQTRADQNGEWVVIVQEPLSAGQHELHALQHIEGRAPVASEQVVVAVVPKPPADAAQPMDSTLVMIAPSSGPASPVQVPSAAGLPRSGDLQMSTLDYDEHGRVTISGQAGAGTVVRAYVDDKMVAEGQTDIDGRWRLAPADSVAAGQHRLRLDRLAKDGRPVARLELPFERIPVQARGGDNRQLIVVQGDSLWNIARAYYGHGMHHTLIYGANKNQIRNPDLIYPGQVFSLPKVN
jgi:LysM domain-containing protein